MTTAHRPTFRSAQGGGGKYDRGTSISKQYSSRDIVAHTELKLRQDGQASVSEVASKDLKAELQRREAEAAERRRREDEQRAGLNAISAQAADGGSEAIAAGSRPAALEAAAPESKKARLTHIQPNALDADDDVGGDGGDDKDDDDDSDDDEDDTAQLLAELEKIKKERAEEQARKEMEKSAQEDQVRREAIMQGNPLLRDKSSSASDFTVKRRWDDDVVFKNCAKPEEKNKKANFVNDSLRSEYHRRFMEKFIK